MHLLFKLKCKMSSDDPHSQSILIPSRGQRMLIYISHLWFHIYNTLPNVPVKPQHPNPAGR